MAILCRVAFDELAMWGARTTFFNLYTLPIHELKKGVKLGDTFG